MITVTKMEYDELVRKLDLILENQAKILKLPFGTPYTGEAINLTPQKVRLLAYHEYSKIPIIKVIRKYTGFGLREAKEASENLPFTFTNVSDSKEFAEELRLNTGIVDMVKE